MMGERSRDDNGERPTGAGWNRASGSFCRFSKRILIFARRIRRYGPDMLEETASDWPVTKGRAPKSRTLCVFEQVRVEIPDGRMQPGDGNAGPRRRSRCWLRTSIRQPKC